MSSSGDEQTPGRTVAGRYRLEQVLGRGGMGVVWLAVDTLIERRVALKELRAPVEVAGGDEAPFVERALREARNAGRLNHPGVVAVHDVIAPTGDADAMYIVMEYVEAPTLGDLIDGEGPLPAPRVAGIGLGILDALLSAHAMGIVHRDIKPSNVLVGAGDRVKLTDFGIALAAEDARLTRSGVMGTHAYLAPEAFDTGEVGPAADLWALGATLFHAVAGQPPFERATTTASLRAILFEDPPAPPCSAPLSDVITGLLTRPVTHRLTSDAARPRLVEAAAQPVAPAATPPPGPGGWEAQATTVHRAPTPPPGPLPPPMPVPPPPGHPGSGSGPAWGGPPSPPLRNTTPWIVGGVAALAAIVLLFVVLGSGGGSGSGSGARGSAGAELAQRFVDTVNNGEDTAALAMLCASSSYDVEVRAAIAGLADLEIDSATVDTDGASSFGALLEGTVYGAPIVQADTYISVIDEDTGPCIYRFDLGPDFPSED